MNTIQIELNHDMVDELVKGQLKYWADHFKQEAEGTATWYVHPKDQDDAHAMYAAVKYLLDNLYNGE